MEARVAPAPPQALADTNQAIDGTSTPSGVR